MVDQTSAPFIEFMNQYDLCVMPIQEFPSYSIDIFGNVYDENNNMVIPYHYSGQYDAVYLKDSAHHKKCDVHVLVAKTFIQEYYEGCVVHHIDGNKYNNYYGNLEILDKRDHARYHADPTALLQYAKTHTPYNKGRKMSDEFRERCRSAAKKRWENGVYQEKLNRHLFYGNQYVDGHISKK